jgi:hypothetical protein
MDATEAASELPETGSDVKDCGDAVETVTGTTTSGEDWTPLLAGIAGIT